MPSNQSVAGSGTLANAAARSVSSPRCRAGHGVAGQAAVVILGELHQVVKVGVAVVVEVALEPDAVAVGDVIVLRELPVVGSLVGIERPQLVKMPKVALQLGLLAPPVQGNVAADARPAMAAAINTKTIARQIPHQSAHLPRRSILSMLILHSLIGTR